MCTKKYLVPTENFVALKNIQCGQLCYCALILKFFFFLCSVHTSKILVHNKQKFKCAIRKYLVRFSSSYLCTLDQVISTNKGISKRYICQCALKKHSVRSNHVQYAVEALICINNFITDYQTSIQCSVITCLVCSRRNITAH